MTTIRLKRTDGSQILVTRDIWPKQATLPRLVTYEGRVYRYAERVAGPVHDPGGEWVYQEVRVDPLD